MTKGRSLDVYYQGTQVGTLAMMPDKRVAFQYSDVWLKNGFSISPFSLPLKSNVFIPSERSREMFRGLFGVFADSLPDSWGELLLERYLLSQGKDPANITVLDRLALVGASGMGALEYQPSRGMSDGAALEKLNYDKIDESCRNILSGHKAKDLKTIYRHGRVCGGDHPKLLVKEEDREWIVKFPGAFEAVSAGKREYDYADCAKKCGINMANTRLVASEASEGYFMTERFDRLDGEKIHMVSFSALLERDYRYPTCGYETYMKLISILTRDNKNEKKQMFKAMCFNTLLHNRDDNPGNFSFLCNGGTRWRLAPFYDITYSETFFGEHASSVKGKRKGVEEDDLVFVGVKEGLSESYCRRSLTMIREERASLEHYLETKSFHRKRASALDVGTRIDERGKGRYDYEDQM